MIGRKKIDGQWYKYEATTSSKDKAIKYLRKHGYDKVKIDENVIKNKRSFNIFLKEEPKKEEWKEVFEKKGKQFEQMRKKRLEKEKPIIVDEYSYMRGDKKIIVPTFRRKKPERKKFKKLR